MHRELSTPGLVLRTRSYGESDRIVTLITEQHGKVTGIAKGARNSRRRFAGTLEPFVHVRAVFRQRPTTDLVFLVRCELLGTLRAFTRDLDRFAAGSYVLELTDRMVHGRESGRDVYHLVCEALAGLDAGADCDRLLRAFELRLLAVAGWAPALDRCRGCGRPVADLPQLYLAAERGGLVCRGCVAPDEPVRPVGAATVHALARFSTEPLHSAGTGLTSATCAEAAVVAERLIDRVIATPLRARELIARTRVDSPSGVR